MSPFLSSFSASFTSFSVIRIIFSHSGHISSHMPLNIRASSRRLCFPSSSTKSAFTSELRAFSRYALYSWRKASIAALEERAPGSDGQVGALTLSLASCALIVLAKSSRPEPFGVLRPFETAGRLSLGCGWFAGWAGVVRCCFGRPCSSWPPLRFPFTWPLGSP